MIKRITLASLAFIACMALNAQEVIFEEDFSEETPSQGTAELPSDWSVYNEDSNTPNDPTAFSDAWVVGVFDPDVGPTATSTSWFNPPGQADHWMVTPEISIPADETTVLFYSDFAPDPSFPNNYEILISTTGNTISDFEDDAIYENTPEEEYTEHTVNLEDYAGEDIYIAFRDVSDDENMVSIGDISVESLEETDLAIESIELNDILSEGENEISFVVSNVGAEEVTSFDATWSVDGEEVTETFSNVNLESLSTEEFTFDEAWDIEVGDYTLTIELEDINGEGDDDNMDNNNLSKDISVATNTATKKPMYEEFTSSNCGPCKDWNEQAFVPFFDGLENEPYSLVKYPANIPSADPYFTDEVQERMNYYEVQADPTLYFEGVEEDYGSIEYLNEIPDFLQDQYDEIIEEDAFFDMEVESEMNGESVSVEINTTPYVSGEYTLRAAVIEMRTTENTGINGETEFFHVMMKMLPDADGTVIDFSADETETTTFDNIDLSDTNVEDFGNLQVVVWIQNDETKEVMQSENSGDQMLGVDDFTTSDITMYPNPAKDQINFQTEEKIDVVIYDLLGKEVIVENEVQNNEVLDISHLNSGVYTVKIKQGSSVNTKKLIVD